jgi:hypothetical protein
LNDLDTDFDAAYEYFANNFKDFRTKRNKRFSKFINVLYANLCILEVGMIESTLEDFDDQVFDQILNIFWLDYPQIYVVRNAIITDLNTKKLCICLLYLHHAQLMAYRK